MSDVLFRYLLKAREHDRSWLQRAFLSDERRLAAGIERVVETAAIRLEVVSQHQRITMETVTGPASRQRDVTFVDHAHQSPPVPGQPATRTDRHPLRSTLRLRTCRGCDGTGKVACHECMGTGTASCRICYSSGGPCPACLGRRRWPCGDCDRTGAVPHEKCCGEGQFAIWDEEVHTYTARTQADTFLPDGAPNVAGAAVEQWLSHHPASTSGSLQEALTTALGCQTPELAAVVRRVEMRRASFTHHAQSSSDGTLFVDVRYQVVPMSACYARSEVTLRPTCSWLVGSGPDAMELQAGYLVDPWKVLGWPGLAVGSVTAAEAWMQLHGASLLLPSAATSALVPAALAGVAVAGVAGAAVGLRRVLAGGRSVVRTVTVLSCSGKPTLFLPCLAALGSYVGTLEVIDRVWRKDLESLLVQEQQSPLSRTLGVRTAKGELVRFIEVADPYRLVPDEARRMTEASLGFLFLETPETSLDALRSWIHAATVARPTELRLVIDCAADTADDHGRTPEDRLALEAIRRAFTGGTGLQLDWAAVFAELWGPVSALLSEPEGQRPANLRVTTPPRFAARARS